MDDDIRFHGHPCDHWLRLRTTGDDEQRWEAIDAIRHICAPEESIPLLLDTPNNDSYSRARGLSAHALFDMAIGPQSARWRPLLMQSLPKLQSALEDTDQSVRTEIGRTIELLASPEIQDESD